MVLRQHARPRISAGRREEQKWKSSLTFLERMGYAPRQHAWETAHEGSCYGSACCKSSRCLQPKFKHAPVPPKDGQKHKKEAAWHKATLAAIAKYTQVQRAQGAKGVLPIGASALTRK